MDEGNSPYDPALGDWQTLARFFSPTEACLLRGCLQAAGVPAALADAHLVQTYSLLASAVPVRVLVPERCLAQARAVMAAYQRGDYSLPDDEPTASMNPLQTDSEDADRTPRENPNT
ncbi:DUF2007 domain-containing protein [Hydrogenophaga sp.]|uniref:putative signal transducing protein n=1 Tax=Hydrogenophaga sp. TaxID=1904254 RepID=UPI001991CCB1|nr:DUF2007 domain-containing protein [Hydrogenophaga sp.]MBD3893911.1 DUF2007 domain-containing protein [Hydrogenophaga sp.]